MPLLVLLIAAAIAFSLGIVASVLLRVGGLIVIVAGMTAIFAARLIFGAAHPDLAESALLLILLQMGYLLGALTPLADLLRKPAPLPPILDLQPDPRPELRPKPRAKPNKDRE